MSVVVAEQCADCCPRQHSATRSLVTIYNQNPQAVCVHVSISQSQSNNLNNGQEASDQGKKGQRVVRQSVTLISFGYRQSTQSIKVDLAHIHHFTVLLRDVRVLVLILGLGSSLDHGTWLGCVCLCCGLICCRTLAGHRGCC